MKKNKVTEDALRKMASYIIIVSVVFISVILLFVIYMEVYLKSPFKYNANNNIEDILIKNDFKELVIEDSYINLEELCMEGCEYKRDDFGVTNYYKINHENDEYKLFIIANGVRIDEISLGKTITNLTIGYYKDNIIFKYVYNDDVDTYDEVILYNGTTTQVITSMSTNEIELTDEGIIYYQFVCLKDGYTNTMKQKYLLTPFNSIPILLSEVKINYSKC